MKYLLSSKHKSKGNQPTIEHEAKSPLPVLELSFNDNFRIMPDLSRRFTLLRNNAGGFLPIGTVQQHLEYQRERGQLTRSEENLILQELTKHTTIYEEEPSDSHTSVPKSTDHSSPIKSPIKTSSTGSSLFGSSSLRDTAYLQKEFKASSVSKVKSTGGVTRRPKEPIIQEEPVSDSSLAPNKFQSDQLFTEPVGASVTPKAEEQSLSCTLEVEAEEDLVLTPVRLQRISMALDRILGDHLPSSQDALKTHTPLSTSDNVGSGSVSGQSNESPRNPSHSPSTSLDKNAPGSNSAASRVHDELFKALSTTPSTASGSPSFMTRRSSLRCSDDFKPEPTSSIESGRVYSGASSHERQFSQSSLTSTRSSTALSSCFHSSHDDLSEHEHNTSMCLGLAGKGSLQTKDATASADAGISANVTLPCDTINRDQTLPDSNIRYTDLIAIQATLVASAPASSTERSSRVPSATEPSPSPKTALGRSMSNSTASFCSARILSQSAHVARPDRSVSIRKQASTTKLSRGIGSCHRMRSASQSAESFSPSSDPFIRISSVSPPASVRQRSTGVPPLISSSPSAFTPESQSFPLTPVLSQQLDPNPRHQNLLGQHNLFSNDMDKHLGIHQVSSLPDVKEESQPPVGDPPPPLADDVEAPMRSQAEAAAPAVIWPKRAQPGRANRPVPTTLLFRDVEAQAVAANAALRYAATQSHEPQAGDGAVKKESVAKAKKDIKKKKSIIRAQIGAPQLVSASANLASLELDQAALVLRANAQASSTDTADQKRGSTKSSFKLKLKKKKPSDEVGTHPEEPSRHSAVKGQMGRDRVSTTSQYDPNAPATVTPALLHTLSSDSGSLKRSGSRETDGVNGVERSNKTQSNSLGPPDGKPKHSLRWLLTSRTHSKPGIASPPILPLVPSFQGADLCPWEPVCEEAIAEVKEEVPDLKQSRLSSDWVDVPPIAIEAVAPLKIMKVSGSIRDNTMGAKLRAVRTDGDFDPTPGDHSTTERALEPPKNLSGDLPGDKRPSTDSVQRLLNDLGLPLQQNTDASEIKEKFQHVLEENEDGKDMWDHHSAKAKGKGRATPDDKVSIDKSCSPAYDPCTITQTQEPEIYTRLVSKSSKKSTVDDDTPAQDTLPPNSLPDDSSNPVRPHVPFPTLSEDLDEVNVLELNNLMVTVPDHDDTRSDYAASILDLYDRPESSIWEQPCATEGNPISNGDKVNRLDGATPDMSRVVDNSFLDISGSPTDQWQCRSSIASSSGSGGGVTRASGEKNEDDVMMIMNKFRKDVTSHRVSTASGLFSAISGQQRSRKPSNVNGAHDGARRKTVMEDEEDEKRAWKLILGE
ncbi:hypothetical protein DFH28DRAFT_1170081 [Melampsora americana]|nr:hypothetical protein DFH28DRAFT_1170081 [Melampsora americana]